MAENSNRVQNDRSQKAKKNILISLFLKGFSLVISFVLIPLTIGYLSTYEYGVWLTLSSLLHWMDFMDIGLGNGLRNKLSESLAKNDMVLSRCYVSTTFFALIVIMLVFYSIFFAIGSQINWYSLLHVTPDLITNLLAIVLIVTAMTCLNFIFKITTYVYFAKQVAMINNLIPFLSQLLSLLIIYILTKAIEGNLLYVALVYSAAPVIVLIIIYPITFYVKYRELSPNYKFIRFEYLRSLLGLGVEFFLLKIGGLLIFATSNIFISNILTPDHVTPYGLCQKYYSIITMIYLIIITPMWSAATDAYVRKDFIWIKRTCNKMMRICVIFILVTVLMTLFSGLVYKLWLNNMVIVPMSLNILIAIYVSIINISTCYSHFLFGIGKLRLQIYSTILSGMLFLFTAPFLIKTYGVIGAAIALIIANVPSAILNPLQFRILMSNNKNHNKIWYK